MYWTDPHTFYQYTVGSPDVAEQSGSQWGQISSESSMQLRFHNFFIFRVRLPRTPWYLSLQIMFVVLDTVPRSHRFMIAILKEFHSHNCPTEFWLQFLKIIDASHYTQSVLIRNTAKSQYVKFTHKKRGLTFCYKNL